LIVLFAKDKKCKLNSYITKDFNYFYQTKLLDHIIIS